MIKGVHTMFYSSKAAELRAFFRDKLKFPSHDVGEGWLIFDMPDADLGVHPTQFPGSRPSGTHAISFYCDDLRKTVDELKSRGVEFTRDIKNEGFGMTTAFKAPGDLQIMLYQPLYQKT